MRRAFSLLSIVLTSLALISCADDVDIDINNRTVDVRENNAELIGLGILQSTFFAHLYSPLYDFLDGTDLPQNAISSGPGNQYSLACNVAGSIQYDYSRASGEVYKKGDTISVEYFNCDNGNGLVHNGKLSAAYSVIDGLNDQFVEIDTDSCIGKLQASLAGSETIIEVSGELVVFRDDEENLRVWVDDQATQHLIGPEETAIVVNRRQNLPAGAVTSVNGDEIYSVEDRESAEELCQGYGRTLTTDLDNFNTKKGALEFTLDGSVKLFEGTEDLVSFATEIRNSRFTTLVKQGNLEERYTMAAYTVTETFDALLGVYVYEFDGEVSSSAIFGTVEVLQTAVLSGNFADEYPHTGTLRILGRDQEQIAVIPDDLRLSLQVDIDGDSTGNTFPDVDTIISTSWPELLNREFKITE